MSYVFIQKKKPTGGTDLYARTPEFQESLGYIVRPHENKTQKIKTQVLGYLNLCRLHI